MARTRTDNINVWPAFTDTMLAFVLVLVLMLSYQIARSVELESVEQGVQQRERDQTRVQERLDSYRDRGYSNIELAENGNIQNITFGSDVTFEAGSAELSTRGVQLLRGLAQTIMGPERSDRLQTLIEIQVSGHTDNVAINTIAYPSNWELSTARATQVVKSLIDGGVDPTEITMSATGYGEYESRAANQTARGRLRNRRIEMRLIYSDSMIMEDESI